MNIKEGFDNPDGVSARAKGFLLMIEKFQHQVRLVDGLDRVSLSHVRLTAARHGLANKYYG